MVRILASHFSITRRDNLTSTITKKAEPLLTLPEDTGLVHVKSVILIPAPVSVATVLQSAGIGSSKG